MMLGFCVINQFFMVTKCEGRYAKSIVWVDWGCFSGCLSDNFAGWIPLMIANHKHQNVNTYTGMFFHQAFCHGL